MPGVSAQIKAIKQRTQSLVQLNLELAKLEGKQKATAVGIPGGLGAVAAVLVVYAIGITFAAIAAELRSLLPLVVAGLAVVALVTFRKSTSSGLRMIWRLV